MKVSKKTRRIFWNQVKALEEEIAANPEPRYAKFRELLCWELADLERRANLPQYDHIRC